MLSGGSAPVSVFVCSVCLFALLWQPVRGNRCSQDLVRRVGTLKRNVTNKEWLDSRLYTPTIQEVKQKCPGSSLKCFAAEMKVLTKELLDCGLRYVLRLKIGIGLERLAKQFNQTESGCHQCEFFTEKNVTTFLTDLLVILEMVNEQYC